MSCTSSTKSNNSRSPLSQPCAGPAAASSSSSSGGGNGTSPGRRRGGTRASREQGAVIAPGSERSAAAQSRRPRPGDVAGRADCGNTACQSEARAAAPESPAQRPVLDRRQGRRKTADASSSESADGAAGGPTPADPHPLPRPTNSWRASAGRLGSSAKGGEASPRLSLSQASFPVTSRLLATAGEEAGPEVG